MRLVIISDTHGLQERLGVLTGDVLIHCGDIGNIGEQNSRTLQEMDDWFGRQKFDRIFVIGGNHDSALQTMAGIKPSPFKHAQYLEDSLVKYRGVSFYGAPWVPDLTGWAYYADREKLREAWAKIPASVDVLITHTPPYGILDLPSRGTVHAGCPELTEALERIQPALHCFGHIHASYGIEQRASTLHINAALLGKDNQLNNEPLKLDLDRAQLKG